MSKDKLKIKPLEPGEIDLRKVFEQVTTNNVLTIQDYTRQTRTLVRDLEAKVDHLEQNIASKDKEVKELRQQISNLQAKVYADGTQ